MNVYSMHDYLGQIGGECGMIDLASTPAIESVSPVSSQVRYVEMVGAFADLLLVNGNPLKNLGLMQNQGRDLSMIMKAGRFHKNTLTH